MKKFEVGQRVIRKDSVEIYEEYEGDQAIRGAVMSLDASNATVKWDNKWMTPNPQKVSINNLLPENEGDEKLSKLEEEYNLWADPIKEKMEAAAKLLEEADELADKQKRNLAEMHNLTSPLIHAMSNIGWSTSSLSC